MQRKLRYLPKHVVRTPSRALLGTERTTLGALIAPVVAAHPSQSGDAIGRVLIDRIVAAADCGVRVRLLVDDYASAGHDTAFDTLAAHRNVEVRVFKAAVFDRKTVFVGLFNLDPRSAALDTETVFVLHSPELAEQLLESFATDFEPANAWRIGEVAGKHKVAWITEQPAQPVVEPHDPAGAWRRFVRSIEKALPIRSLL